MESASATTSPRPLRLVVYKALRSGGIDLLRNPKRLIGHVSDIADPSDRLTATFEQNCDSEFLAPLVQVTDSPTEQALEDAANKMTVILSDERLLREDIARRIACEVVFGTASCMGVACPEQIVREATAGFAQQAPKKPQSRPEPESSAPEEPPAQRPTHEASADPGAAQAPSGAPNPTAPRPGATPTSAIDYASMSTNPLTRERQAEEAGIKLKWFRVIKALCYLYVVFQIPTLMSLLGTSDQGNATPIMSIIIWTVLYATAGIRLSKFKSGSIEFYQTVCAVNIVLQAVATLFTPGLILASYFSIALQTAVWFANQSYLEKRKDLFTL